ncbi:cysteine desulfurase family protein [Alkalibacterium gilvum]|uniref:cysteine desulfurase family protein n=1 Tax=Alkalibacterium gilvum TaxID=1130080 RepID=UPI003F90A44C
MSDTIYLDHAATTPMHPEVIEVMSEAMKHYFGNASSIHQLGRESRGIIEEARRTFAESINANPQEIIITSGGTESDNMAIIKSAEKYKGKHIITTEIEHPAVLKPLDYLSKQGYDITYLTINNDGQITLEQIKNALREDTFLVSIMYGNNEIGSMMPIQKIGHYLKEEHPDILFHTDAVQAYGTEEIDVRESKIDLLSVSSHKINGPKGVGFLYKSNQISLAPLILGGEQENKLRAGTENLPAIIGFKKAVEVRRTNKKETKESYLYFKKLFISKLQENNIDFDINGTIEDSLSHILSVHLNGIPSDKLLIHLDLENIAVSSGSACSAGTVGHSHVLTSLYDENHPAVEETIRISFGLGIKEEDIIKSVDKIKKASIFLKGK